VNAFEFQNGHCPSPAHYQLLSAVCVPEVKHNRRRLSSSIQSLLSLSSSILVFSCISSRDFFLSRLANAWIQIIFFCVLPRIYYYSFLFNSLYFSSRHYFYSFFMIFQLVFVFYLGLRFILENISSQFSFFIFLLSELIFWVSFLFPVQEIKKFILCLSLWLWQFIISITFSLYSPSSNSLWFSLLL